jgi:hypothetical protein
VGSLASAGSSDSSTPKPAEGSLSIGLSREEKSGADGAYLRILAKGPFDAPSTTLLDAAGQSPVEVTEADAAQCDQLDEHRALASGADREWCLRLDGIADATKVEGSIAASQTSLKLTVSRRTGFLGTPLVLVLLGVLAGIIVILLPPWLKNRIRPRLLNATIKKNDEASSEDAVSGLRDFVDDRRELGDEDDVLLPLVTKVIKRGPNQARAARARLKAALRDVDGIPARFAESAAEEAGRADNKREDFLDEEAKLVDHPAEKYLDALEELREQNRVLEHLRSEVAAIPDPAARAKASEKVQAADSLLNALVKPEQVGDVDDALQEIRLAIAAATESGPTVKAEILSRLSPVNVAADESIRVRSDRWGPRPRSSGEISRAIRQASPRTSVGPYILVTLAICLLVVAWAILAIEQSVYEPKDAFGTFDDYVALVTAAIGSGAAASVIGFVALFDPLHPTGDS